MNLKQLISKNKHLSGFAMDSIWTMIGLVAMNGIAQFVVYPFMRNMFGADGYGRILSMLGIINIVAISFGSALNNARLVAKAKGKGSENRPYNLSLLIIILMAIPLSVAVFLVLKEPVLPVSLFLYWLLMCMTIVRYYSEVEYRLHTNYKGLLLYYIIISGGYLVGLIPAKITGYWMLSLLIGETAGFLFVFFKGSIFKKSNGGDRSAVTLLWKSAGYLISAQLLINVIFNSDRIFLQAFCESSTVTTYYIASAVGKMISLVTSSFNSVIIGYLVKKKNSIETRAFKKIFFVSCVGSIAAIGLCYIGSIVYTKLFYPADYGEASPFFIIANAAQIFYFVSGIFTTILLRYAKERIQTRINIIYTIVFCIATIPATYFYGIWGYAAGLLVSNVFRFGLAVILCYTSLKRSEKENKYGNFFDNKKID